MARIEVFFEYGKLLGVFQKMKPPMFITVLRDQNGKSYPIYEGHNEIAPGKYEIYVFQPFKTSGEKLEKAGYATNYIDVAPGTTVDHIVIGYFEGKLHSIFSCQGMSDDQWNLYAQSRGDRLQRYIGWTAEQALRML